METSPLHRHSAWEDALTTYLDRVRETHFAWGSHDCACFVGGAVKAMTGVDPAASIRGKYTDKLSAAQVLRDHAYGTLRDTLKAWFGEAVHPAFAKRGDLVTVNDHTVGVCVGLYSYFVGTSEQGVEGLTFVPTADCEEAFVVPFVPQVTNE